jgi:HEAT repeat protein
MLYNGLVGSSPENQRQFKDVRADMKLAIESESSQQVASLLKLAPLWWEEKLKTIFGDYTDRAVLLKVLAPDVKDEALSFEDVPLLHEDWQVRANAAMLLAHLNATEAVDKLVGSLHDTARGARNAFPYIANAIGKLRVPGSEEALMQYTSDDDPWIQVDLASALAKFDDQPTKHLLAVLVNKHSHSDYTAVAVSRIIKPELFFGSGDELSVTVGCQIVSDLLDASLATFNKETVVELGVPECFPHLAKLIDEHPSCTIATTATRLANWLENNHSYMLMSPPSQEEIQKVIAYSSSPACRQLVSDTLEKLTSDENLSDPVKLCDLRSAIDFAAKHQMNSESEKIQRLLKSEHPLLDNAIEALSRLDANEAAPKLIEIARAKVDLEERCQLPKQLNPVQEPSRAKAKTYWLILKTLGTLPTRESADFLFKATDDHAPDKRAQAFESLIAVIDESDDSTRKELIDLLQSRLSEALVDPAADVRKTALRGVATFAIVSDLEKVVGLTKAREVSTQREAFDTLSELAKKGHKKDVLESVSQAMKSEPNVHKRQKLRDFIDDTSR